MILMTRIAVLTALAVSLSSAIAAPAADLKLDFGDKDKGKPHATDAGVIAASGRAEVPDAYLKPRIEVLIRPAGKKGYRIYDKEAKLEKGIWKFETEKLMPGTYQVRVRLVATNATGDQAERQLPDFADKPNYIEVEVK